MGQNANINTIKRPEKNISLRNNNSQETLNYLQFLHTLKRSLNKKGIFICNLTINKNLNIFEIESVLFFKTHKLIKLKNKLIPSVLKKSNLSKYNKLFQNNKTIFSMVILNKYLNKKELKNLFIEFKRYKAALFSRRFYLFIDFIKLTYLFNMSILEVKPYLMTLGLILKFLSKKKHGQFFFFLKHLFKKLTQDKKNKIAGIKIIVNGRLKGKLKADLFSYSSGKLNKQSIDNNFDYNKINVYTIYGAFGIKMWVNFV